MEKRPNRLINEKSPYLLQHAYNPVNWFPWCDEAFEKAKREDKPIFLSIGYSTCHWCHVMERESFEDETVANLLNENFVSIKVDREQMPHIDAFYMEVCQVLTGKGGWPLSIFMTPDKKPFFAGTYFPKESIGNLIGLTELIKAIAFYWNHKREELLKSANEVVNIIENIDYEKSGFLDSNVFHNAFDELSKNFDYIAGGFGIQPKFPPYNNLLFLLKYYQMTRNEMALNMVEKTLRAIRKGGIYDFIAGGIHRYSTDRIWKLPHFEKMLYDQALMSLVFSKTYFYTGNILYLESAKEILDYCIEYLSNDEGGFFCGEDADSEGEEGNFYLWTYDELKECLDEDSFIEFTEVFNISERGNFQEETTGEYKGKNVLYMSEGYLARYEKDETFKKRIKESLMKLKKIREQSIRPARDEKILLDWNCLMIIALCSFYKISGEERYLKKVVDTINFIEKHFIKPDYTLFHSYFKDEAKVDGFLEDYAFLVWVYIELYQTFFDNKWLDKAIDVNKKIFTLFEDKNEGGFFHTPVFNMDIPVRQKILFDSVMPSGNSVCLNNLLKLWILTEDSFYYEKAKKIIEFFSGVVCQSTVACSYFISSFSLYFDYPGKVKLSGKIKGKHILDKIKKLTLLDWLFEFEGEDEKPLKASICSKKNCLPQVEGDNIIEELDKLINITL